MDWVSEKNQTTDWAVFKKHADNIYSLARTEADRLVVIEVIAREIQAVVGRAELAQRIRCAEAAKIKSTNVVCDGESIVVKVDVDKKSILGA